MEHLSSHSVAIGNSSSGSRSRPHGFEQATKSEDFLTAKIAMSNMVGWKHVVIGLAAAISFAGWPSAHAATIGATNCSASAVSAAIASANNGDTVTVPAGNCTWNSLSLPTGKSINLLGAGAGITNITVTGAIAATCSSGFPHRISGFRFTIGAGGLQMVNMRGNCSGMRFDHNEVLHTNASFSGTDAVVVNDCNLGTGRVYALIDHNTFRSTVGNFRAVLMIGPTCPEFGKREWQSSTMGTANNVFIEDNVFDFYQNTDQGSGVVDANYASTFVFRNNTVINSSIKAHGVCNAEGTPSKEIYNNTLVANSRYTWPDGTRLIHDQGSGELMVFGNRFTAVTKGGAAISLLHYRSADPGVAGCTLLPRCNGNSAADGNWLPATSFYGYPCYHQPGRKSMNALSPIYLWDNQWADTGGVVPLNLNDPWGGTPNIRTHVVANRDFYDYVKTGFDGTVGTGVGTLANRPATCTTNSNEAGGGAGYWATDNQTLYRCSATNTWVAHYRPYTYPHPLTLAGGTTPLSAPGNLRLSP